MPCQEKPQARASPTDTKSTSHSALCGTKRSLTIFSGFIVSSPAHPQSLWSRAVTLMSISSVEQKGLCFPALCVEGGCRAPLQGYPCLWPPGWEPAGPGFAWGSYCFFHGERIFCQSLQQDQCLLSCRGQAGSCALHSCPHGQGCDTSTGSTHLGWLEQLQHCSPPGCHSGPDHWQPDSQAPSGISEGIQLPGSQETLSENGIPQVYKHRNRLRQSRHRL